MIDGPTDQEIVQGLRQGQPCAWSALCERYGSRLWGYLARLIGPDAGVVSDVLQETLIAAAQSGRSLDRETRLWSWLATIGHRQACLHWRRTYRRTEVHQSYGQHRTTETTLPDVVCQREQAALVRQLLADLPGDYAVLLAAKYFDDLSVAEIVEQHGGTIESVRSKLARARREFRQRYEELDDPPEPNG